MNERSATAAFDVEGKSDLLERASSHYKRREFTEAAGCFKILLQSYPNDVEILRDFARLAHEMRAEQLACSLLSRAARLRPHDADILVDLSNAFIRVRSPLIAKDLLKQAVSVERNNARAHSALIRLYIAHGDEQRARKLYAHAAKISRTAEELAAQELEILPVYRLWRDISSKDSVLADLGAEPDRVREFSKMIALLASLLSEDECRQIVRSATARASRPGTLSEGAIDEEMRQSSVHWLRWSEIELPVARRLLAFLEHARRQFAISEIDQIEHLQVSRYTGQNSGHFDWHKDSEDLPEGNVRKISLTVQLSHPGSYQGGDLEIGPGESVTQVPRVQGDAIVFRSSRHHRVTRVAKGERWSMVCWARGPLGGHSSGLKLLG